MWHTATDRSHDYLISTLLQITLSLLLLFVIIFMPFTPAIKRNYCWEQLFKITVSFQNAKNVLLHVWTKRIVWIIFHKFSNMNSKSCGTKINLTLKFRHFPSNPTSLVADWHRVILQMFRIYCCGYTKYIPKKFTILHITSTVTRDCPKRISMHFFYFHNETSTDDDRNIVCAVLIN